MDKVNISEKLSLFSDHWNPRVVGRLNGQHVRLAKFQGEVVWHQHDHEDELFLVIRGSFEMQFRDRVETLNEGEFIIVPRRVEHCPRAEEEVQVLLFEPASTLNTGEAESELTVRELGHTVVGCGRSQTGVDELAAEFGKPHRFAAVDVAVWPEVEAWAASVLSEMPPPDLLINNAGVINRNAPLWEVSAEEFAQVLNTNVDGTANVIRAFLPAMIDDGRGVIVNMSSGWGRSTSPEVAPYCASKWAVEGLTRALSQELPSGLAAVAVSPGVVDTTMLRSCWGESAAASPSPEVWAKNATDFLLSLNTGHNGESLSV